MHCGEGSGLNGEKQSLYEIYPKSNGSLVWNSIRHDIPGLTNYTVGYPNGMVKANDGYVYVFGSRGLGFGSVTQIFVARFSQTDPLTWTFWNGTIWATKPPATDAEFTKAKLYEGQGASAAVGYINGKYVLITLDQGFWATNDRFVRGAVANSPTSKFSAAKRLYSIREYIYGKQVRYYTPNIHTQSVNGRNELLITYSINYSTDDKQDITVNVNNEKIVGNDTVVKGAYIDPYFYRVKGVRVPYSILGIPAVDPTPSEIKNSPSTEIELYPNPANEFINLKSAISLEGSAFEVYNMMGSVSNVGKIKENKVGIQSLSTGFYKLVIKKNNTIVTKSFIKT